MRVSCDYGGAQGSVANAGRPEYYAASQENSRSRAVLAPKRPSDALLETFLRHQTNGSTLALLTPELNPAVWELQGLSDLTETP